MDVKLVFPDKKIKRHTYQITTKKSATVEALCVDIRLI